jgi:hypothetical protein
MKLESVKIEFESFVRQYDFKFERLTLASSVQLMLDFYKQFRVDGCPINNNGDMLLFAWGTYNWGEGSFFQCDITRQFVSDGLDGDDAISQLSVRVYFDPAGFSDLKSGSRWCESLDDVVNFEMFILANDAFISVATKQPAKVSVDYSQV